MSLTLTRADLEDEVGRALGYGRGTLSGDVLEDVTVCTSEVFDSSTRLSLCRRTHVTPLVVLAHR